MRTSTLLRAVGLSAVLLLVGGSSAEVQERTRPAARNAAPMTPPPRPTPAKPRHVAELAPGGQVDRTPAASTGQARPPAWSSRCTSANRRSPPACVLEQNAFVQQTGQLLTSVTLRLPPGGNQPVMMLQVPVGLYLPAGIVVQIDDRQPDQFVVQTCDLKGCYAGVSLSAELLDAMKTGTRFAVTFQNLARQNITVPLTLAQFAESYQRIQ